MAKETSNQTRQRERVGWARDRWPAPDLGDRSDQGKNKRCAHDAADVWGREILRRAQRYKFLFSAGQSHHQSGRLLSLAGEFVEVRTVQSGKEARLDVGGCERTRG